MDSVADTRGCWLVGFVDWVHMGWVRWQCGWAVEARRYCDASDSDLVSPTVDARVGDMLEMRVARRLIGRMRRQRVRGRYYWWGRWSSRVELGPVLYMYETEGHHWGENFAVSGRAATASTAWFGLDNLSIGT